MNHEKNPEINAKPNITPDKTETRQTKPNFHGSDIEAVADYYQIPKEDIVCFSANVNPLGLSSGVKKQLADHLDILSSYPDRNYTSLKNVIGSYCGISPAHVIVGNGSTELISLLIQTRRPQKALILSPTYSEYSRELSLVGGKLVDFHLREEYNFTLNLPDFCREIQKGYDLVILCNPNNPTSSALTVPEIEQILAICQSAGSFLMIDETYVEFAPEITAISAMPLISKYDNLMVLRGVSKFFAAPGMRLGYGATSNKTFLAVLTRMQNPWSLNSLAAYAGELMLTDTEYIHQTRTLVKEERARMCAFLSKFDCLKVYPAYANFILLKLTLPQVTASDAFEYLIRQGLMVRDCSSFGFEGAYLRFCIMKPEANTRLLRGIEEFIRGEIGSRDEFEA